ncbi:LytR C-terminal domain-containing protein [Nesterenkonia suensis]
MSKFPHDEFDDVPPYQQGEAGKHRAPAEPAGSSRSGGGLKWIGLLAVVALLVGVVSYFVLPTLREDSPEATDEQEQAETAGEGEDAVGEDGAGEDEEDAGQTGGPSDPAADTESPVQILNHGGPDGLEEELAGQLRELDYNVTYVAEWTYDDVETPVIYYPAGAQEHAQDLAENLGIERVEESAAWTNVAVVVGPDFAE